MRPDRAEGLSQHPQHRIPSPRAHLPSLAPSSPAAPATVGYARLLTRQLHRFGKHIHARTRTHTHTCIHMCTHAQHARTPTRAHTHAHACTLVRTHSCTHAHTCTCAHTRACTRAHPHVRTHMRAHPHMHTHAHACAHTCTLGLTLTHTHTHMHAHSCTRAHTRTHWRGRDSFPSAALRGCCPHGYWLVITETLRIRS